MIVVALALVAVGVWGRLSAADPAFGELRFPVLAVVFVAITWVTAVLFGAIEGSDRTSDPLGRRVMRLIGILVVGAASAAAWGLFTRVI